MKEGPKILVPALFKRYNEPKMLKEITETKNRKQEEDIRYTATVMFSDL